MSDEQRKEEAEVEGHTFRANEEPEVEGHTFRANDDEPEVEGHTFRANDDGEDDFEAHSLRGT